jgi:5,10-methylene-tetrahydrofolate dehydrogenase/methenyl tetrahydrofolate cyclohydrolase
VTIEGKEAVVIGRSNIVGIPVALLLMQRNATVTIAHSRTKDIEAVVRRADIVVAAVGRAEMVKGSWIKPGAVVIDVGINSVDDPSDKRGYRLVGDVDYAGCKEVASAITPVSTFVCTCMCYDVWYLKPSCCFVGVRNVNDDEVCRSILSKVATSSHQ